MRTWILGGMVLGLALAAAPAWALSDADTGAEWVQAPSPQKVAVANILSREIGGDPWKLMQCLDQMFGSGANASLPIREAAKRCRVQQ